MIAISKPGNFQRLSGSNTCTALALWHEYCLLGEVGFSPRVISKSYVWQKEHVRQPLRDEPVDKPSAAWGEPILGDPKNLPSKQTKLFRATRQDFRPTCDCRVSSLASLAAPMWLMDSQSWSADHLVVLNHALAPPDSLRSCDASVSISSVMVIETSSHSKTIVRAQASTEPSIARAI